MRKLETASLVVLSTLLLTSCSVAVGPRGITLVIALVGFVAALAGSFSLADKKDVEKAEQEARKLAKTEQPNEDK